MLHQSHICEVPHLLRIPASLDSLPGTCLRALIAGPEQDAAQLTMYFKTCLGNFNACLDVNKIRIHSLFK